MATIAAHYQLNILQRIADDARSAHQHALHGPYPNIFRAHQLLGEYQRIYRLLQRHKRVLLRNHQRMVALRGLNRVESGIKNPAL